MLPHRALANATDQPRETWADLHLATRPANGQPRDQWLNETREGYRHQAVYKLCLQAHRIRRPQARDARRNTQVTPGCKADGVRRPGRLA